MHRIAIRNVIGALGILAGSYLVAAFANSSPITQPVLTSVYPRGAVIVLPTAPAPERDSKALTAETPAIGIQELKAL